MRAAYRSDDSDPDPEEAELRRQLVRAFLAGYAAAVDDFRVFCRSKPPRSGTFTAGGFAPDDANRRRSWRRWLPTL